jgi:hypothetical protein
MQVQYLDRLPLSSILFPIHYSLIILPLETMESELLTASLNKP